MAGWVQCGGRGYIPYGKKVRVSDAVALCGARMNGGLCCMVRESKDGDERASENETSRICADVGVWVWVCDSVRQTVVDLHY